MGVFEIFGGIDNDTATTLRRDYITIESKPESQRTEPGQRLKLQLKKGRSLNNRKDIDTLDRLNKEI